MAALGHVAVGFAASRLHAGRFDWRQAVAFSAMSLLPDLDVLAFRFGIPYAAPFGHRGASHSLTFALLVGALAWLLTRAPRTGLLVGLTVLTHPLLDALTDGGLGVALFWPLSDARHFAPWTPLPVAPLARGMLSARGASVVAVEALAFLPLWLVAFWPRRVAARA